MKFEIQNDFFNVIMKEIENEKISHAYLIETNGYNEIEKFLDILVKLLLCPQHKVDNCCHECNICNLINTKSYPDLKIIDPSGSWIKKEQLLDIKTAFKEKSIYNNKQIYVITDASKLNSSSGNTMLKFLEEPSPNIIAILLTNNRYNVLDTIRSRCQVFSLKNDDEINLDEKTIDLINTLFTKNNGFLSYNHIITLIPDKLEATKYLKNIEEYFFLVINGKTTIIDNISFVSNEQLVKLILVIEKYLKNFEYNLNYKLMLDNLILDINEVISWVMY